MDKKIRRTLSKFNGFKYIKGDIIISRNGPSPCYWVVQKVFTDIYFIEGFIDLNKIKIRKDIDADTLLNNPSIYFVQKQHCEDNSELYRESNEQ